jgi:hypothetical protein
MIEGQSDQWGLGVSPRRAWRPETSGAWRRLLWFLQQRMTCMFWLPWWECLSCFWCVCSLHVPGTCEVVQLSWERIVERRAQVLTQECCDDSFPLAYQSLGEAWVLSPNFRRSRRDFHWFWRCKDTNPIFIRKQWQEKQIWTDRFVHLILALISNHLAGAQQKYVLLKAPSKLEKTIWSDKKKHKPWKFVQKIHLYICWSVPVWLQLEIQGCEFPPANSC